VPVLHQMMSGRLGWVAPNGCACVGVVHWGLHSRGGGRRRGVGGYIISDDGRWAAGH
jgi:hypothetical protein